MNVIQPTREIRNYALDSRKWDQFPFREGDIVIGTFSKSGTTLTQQIVGQLLSNGDPEIIGAAVSPWIDCFFMTESREMAEAMPDRRFLKSHLPADALPIDPRAKYINVGRDPRDAFWSWHNHHMSFTDGFYEHTASLPGRVGPPMPRPEPDIRKAYLAWIEEDEETEHHGGFWKHVQSWWNLRGQPNVKLMHFNRYKADLEGSIREIAAYLEIPIDEERMPAILEHCSIDYMRNAARGVPMINAIFKKGGDSFFHKGTNGRWKDVLSPEEAALADAKIDQELSPDCAHWIRTGEMV